MSRRSSYYEHTSFGLRVILNSIMCRYGVYGPYKQKFACFSCRKSFKQTSVTELARPYPLAEDGSRLVRCPQCQNRMHNMGLDFKAPQQSDIKQWKKVELLFAHGYSYSSCGCSGPGPRPALLREVHAFLREEQQSQVRWERHRRNEARAWELAAVRKKKQKQRNAKKDAQQLSVPGM